MPTYDVCTRCSGKGMIKHWHHDVVCEACHGEGKILVHDDDEENRDDMDEYLWPESIRWSNE
jgi:DnaJ-class molecular chaperone